MLGMKTISTKGTHGARGAGAGLVAVAAAAAVGLGGCGSGEPIVEGLLKVHVTHDHWGEHDDAEGVGVRYCRNGVDTVLHASCVVSGYTDASGGAVVSIPVGKWWIAYTVWGGSLATIFCSYESEESIYGWLEKVDFAAGDVLDLTGSNRVICEGYSAVNPRSKYGIDAWRHRDWTDGAGGGVAPQPFWAPDSG